MICINLESFVFESTRIRTKAFFYGFLLRFELETLFSQRCIYLPQDTQQPCNEEASRRAAPSARHKTSQTEGCCERCWEDSAQRGEGIPLSPPADPLAQPGEEPPRLLVDGQAADRPVLQVQQGVGVEDAVFDDLLPAAAGGRGGPSSTFKHGIGRHPKMWVGPANRAPRRALPLRLKRSKQCKCRRWREGPLHGPSPGAIRVPGAARSGGARQACARGGGGLRMSSATQKPQNGIPAR